MARRFVILDNLGSRVNWPSIRRKALEGLGESGEGKIRGGKMLRKKRMGVVELGSEELAEKVVGHLNGLVDKDSEVRGETAPWKARLATEEEAGLGEPECDNSRASTQSCCERAAASPPSPAIRVAASGSCRGGSGIGPGHFKGNASDGSGRGHSRSTSHNGRGCRSRRSRSGGCPRGCKWRRCSNGDSRSPPQRRRRGNSRRRSSGARSPNSRSPNSPNFSRGGSGHDRRGAGGSRPRRT